MNQATKVVEILSADELRRTINRLASQIIETTRDLSQLVFSWYLYAGGSFS